MQPSNDELAAVSAAVKGFLAAAATIIDCLDSLRVGDSISVESIVPKVDGAMRDLNDAHLATIRAVVLMVRREAEEDGQLDKGFEAMRRVADQSRRCESATVAAFKREPVKGVVVDEIG